MHLSIIIDPTNYLDFRSQLFRGEVKLEPPENTAYLLEWSPSNQAENGFSAYLQRTLMGTDLLGHK